MNPIPFGVQPAMPPDPYQVHSDEPERDQLVKVQQTNNLPFRHFTGPTPFQVNQPQYLGVNDQIFRG